MGKKKQVGMMKRGGDVMKARGGKMKRFLFT